MSTMFPSKDAGQERQLNPCVKAFGYGPVNTFCQTCAKCRPKDYNRSKRFRCVLRGDVDHSKTWPACSKYVRNPEVQIDS